MKLHEEGNSIGLFNLPKGILMLMIIVGHSINRYIHPWDTGNPAGVPIVIFMLINLFTYGFIPMFFIICGYNARGSSMKKCVRQQIKFCLKPYALVAAAVCIAAVAKKILLHDSILAGLRFYVLPYFLFYCPGDRPRLGVNMASIGPVWFFAVFAFSSILLNAVLLEKRTWAQITIIAVLGIIGIELRDVTLPFCFQQTLICTGYMYLGWLIKKHKFFQAEIPGYIAVIAVCLTVFWGLTGRIEVSYNVWNRGTSDLIVSYVAGLVFLPLVLSLNRFNGRCADFLSWAGRNSLYICCLHTVPYAVFPWEKLAQKMPNLFVGFGLDFIVNLVFALGGSWMIERAIMQATMKKYANLEKEGKKHGTDN